MTTKLQIKKWDAALKKSQDAVADQRDKLDELIAELSELEESCTDAYHAMKDARNALSRLV